jgi:hypothetical protein
MNSDGDKLYMKIVAFDKIYNFVVQTFFVWSHLQTQIIDILSVSGYRKLTSEYNIDYMSLKMTSNKKLWTTKL